MAKARLIACSLGSSRKLRELLLDPFLGEFSAALYPLLVVNSSDWGRMHADAFTVKTRIFPISDRTEEEFDISLDMMHGVGLITRYEIGDKQYLQICNFEEFQKSYVKRRISSDIPESPNIVKDRQAVLSDAQQRSEAFVNSGQCGEMFKPSKGKERKGKEIKKEYICSKSSEDLNNVPQRSTVLDNVEQEPGIGIEDLEPASATADQVMDHLKRNAEEEPYIDPECMQTMRDGIQPSQKLPEQEKPPEKEQDIGIGELFSIFYEAYPRKVQRVRAQRAFKKIKPKPTKELVERMLYVVGRYIASGIWDLKDPQHIPHPATFINGEQWNDVVDHLPEKKPKETKDGQIQTQLNEQDATACLQNNTDGEEENGNAFKPGTIWPIGGGEYIGIQPDQSRIKLDTAEVQFDPVAGFKIEEPKE